MIEDKRDIILSEGVPVEVVAADGTVTQTMALVGRASRTSNAMITLEAHRRGIYLPETSVDSGYVVRNLVTGDVYLAAGIMREVVGGELISVVVHMLDCNTKLSISGMTETVNARGDIVKSNAVKQTDMDVFTQSLNAQLRQQMPGLAVEAEYLVYARGVDVSTLDRLLVGAGSRITPLKVVFTDYFSYPGMVIIQACSETRK